MPNLYLVPSLKFKTLRVELWCMFAVRCFAPYFQSPLSSCLLHLERWATRTTNISQLISWTPYFLVMCLPNWVIFSFFFLLSPQEVSQ